MKAGGDSTVTVLVAFGANLAIAVAKTVAAQLSGSASMSAEAAHSWADTGNEVFLLVANRRGGRAADERRPLGYGREVVRVVAARRRRPVRRRRGGVDLARRDRAAARRRGRRGLSAGLPGAGHRLRAGGHVTAAGRPPTPQRGTHVLERRARVRASDVGSDGARGVRRGQRGAGRHRHRVPRHPAAPAHRRGAVGRRGLHPRRGLAWRGGGRC